MPGGKTCPLTGLPLGENIVLRADVKLRQRIDLWLAAQGVDVDRFRAEARKSGPLKSTAGEHTSGSVPCYIGTY